jgi:hypothetical protein
MALVIYTHVEELDTEEMRDAEILQTLLDAGWLGGWALAEVIHLQDETRGFYYFQKSAVTEQPIPGFPS